MLRKKDIVVNRLGNTPPEQGKFKGLLSEGLRFFVSPAQSPLHRTAILLIFTALLLTATSCIFDDGDDAADAGDGMTVELNIRTRAITSDSETYEVGSTWENYIDIASGDYRIYFFTNDKDDAAATDDSGRNTLLSEFHPLEMTDITGTDYTQYTLSGAVDKIMAEYSDFKIVVLANWGTYPSVTAGTTTIDALVEGENSTFSAETFLGGVDADHLIPFFGVREYSGVTWKSGWRTVLDGDITLLRAIAKVEVVITEDSEIDSFDSVSIAGYNSTGYCAPKGVYLRADYDSGYTDWAGDFTDGIHLVGGANDNGASSNTYPFIRQKGADTDTWTIYLPEYDNTSTSGDYSFIQVKVDGNEYEIYFANYSNDGEAEGTADYDIFRNYLYRFSVKILENHTIRVFVNKWEEVFDNEYEFNDNE